MKDVESLGTSAFVANLLDECTAIHQAIYETFVAYPLENRLPA